MDTEREAVEAEPEADAPEAPEETEAPEEAEAEAGEAEEEAPDYEDVEYDGVTFKAPSSVKEALKRGSEYAQERETFEAKAKERETALAERQKLDDEDLRDRGLAAHLAQTVKEYQGIDWDAWEQQDPEAAQRGWRQFQLLVNNKSDIDKRISDRNEARKAETAKARNARLENVQKHLAKTVKGWGPRTAQAVENHAAKLGFTSDDFDKITDPRVASLIVKDWQANRKETPVEPSPTPRAKGRGARSSAEPSDRDSTEVWVKKRNAQIRKRAQQ